MHPLLVVACSWGVRLDLLRAKFQFSSWSIAEQDDLNLKLSETPKRGFHTSRPISLNWFSFLKVVAS